MATLTWSHVRSWIESNPYKSRSLPKYISESQSVLGVQGREEDGWTKIPVSPATPLSAALLAQDTYYEASSELSRRATLRDETTDLQEKAVLLLKGRSWPMRRTAEGIGACGLEEGRASDWSAIGWRAICALRECQIICISEEKKEISFYPEDVRNWSSTIDTFCVDSECRFLWTRADAQVCLGQWLSSRESAGWTIHWPLAEGNMEDLKAMAAKCPESFAGKMTKDVLQKKIGKSQSYQTLGKWTE